MPTPGLCREGVSARPRVRLPAPFRKPGGQLQRSAEHDVVAAVHLVGLDAETLAGVAAGPLGREQAVVPPTASTTVSA